MNEELRLELLNQRVAYATYLLALTRGELVLLSSAKRQQLAGVLTDMLEAIAEADQKASAA